MAEAQSSVCKDDSKLVKEGNLFFYVKIYITNVNNYHK